jgi:hypothetical protein
VDHAYRTSEPVTPWRTAAIVAAAVASIELFILVIVGVIVGARVMTDKAEHVIAQTQAEAAQTQADPAKATEDGTTKEKTKKTAPVAELPRARTSVIVLNGNGIPAAAAVGADRVRKFHYLIAGTGNAPRTDFQRSVIMFRAGYRGEAIRLGKDLHVRRVIPLDGITKRDLQGAHVAFIIGG